MLIIDEGPTRCNPNNPQQTFETYELSPDGKKLKMSTFGNAQFDVEELSGTTLKIKFTETNTNTGQTGELQITFSKV